MNEPQAAATPEQTGHSVVTRYFVHRHGTVVGPLSSAQLRHIVASGQVTGECGVAKQPTGPFHRIDGVPQLRELITVSGSPEETAKKPPAMLPPPLPHLRFSQPAPSPPSNLPPSPPLNPSPTPAIDPSQNTSANERTSIGAKLKARMADQVGLVVRSGKVVTDRLYEQGRERVSAAYLEATSAVDEAESIRVAGRVVFGRQDAKVDVLLTHPQVSRRHAVLERVGDLLYVSDLGSESGTFIDGNAIHSRKELRPGQELAIGPYRYRWDGIHLVSQVMVDSTELVCRKLTQTVTDRTTQKQLTILNQVSLVAYPREFLVLLGPSGSGKSTLLSALSARTLATSGDVAVNGRNLYTDFESLKRTIAVIPQKDVLHDQLRLRKALDYTAHLRLPPDLSKKELREVTDRLLATVELGDRASTPISALSGGQVKRASVANELIANPGLIFVDEATSGLDEHTDGELMALFRKLAEEGKTIVCVTHNLTNVERYCHRVAILAPGGHLAFIGSAQDALQYFEIRSLGEVYLRLRDKTGSQWQSEFEATDVYRQIVEQVDSVIGPKRPELTRRNKASGLQQLRNFMRQTGLLLRRGLDISLADRNNLLMVFGQCVMVAFLIILLFGDVSSSGALLTVSDLEKTPSILFLLTISAFWFGCNNAAKEIVKERSIYQREQAVNLNVTSYFASKLLLLTCMTQIQIAFLFFSVSMFTGLEGNSIFYSLSLGITGIAGVLLGLAISCYASSENVAVTTVPLVVIPQVILAGLIGKVAGLSKLIACVFITCYWSFGSMQANLPTDFQDLMEDSLANSSYLGSVLAILFHCMILASVGLVRLYAVSRNWTLSRQEVEQWMKTTATTISNQINETKSWAGTPPSAAKPILVRQSASMEPSAQAD